MVRIDPKGIDKWLLRVAEKGQLDTVSHVVRLGATNIEEARAAACEAGHEDVAKFLDSVLAEKQAKEARAKGKKIEQPICRRETHVIRPRRVPGRAPQ